MNNEDLLHLAKRHFASGDYAKSLEACLAYLEIFPEDHYAIRLQAKLHGMDGNLAEAILAITRVIDLVKPSEPCDFFYRGRWLLRNGHTEASRKDLCRVIELSIEYHNNYYIDAANIHLAYLHAMSGNNLEAEKYIIRLDDEAATSINGTVVTKDYLQKLLQQNN